MKFSLLAVTFTLFLAVSSVNVSAQTPSPTNAPLTAQPPVGKPGGMLSSLSREDKAKLLKVRQEVLANNPDLKAEQDSLMKQREALKNDPSDTLEMQLFQDFMAHEQKMKVAMLKVDPTLAPILDKIDQQMKQRFQQRAAAAGGGGN